LARPNLAALPSAIVPPLFDVETLRLTPSQECILADLVGHGEELDRRVSPTTSITSASNPW